MVWIRTEGTGEFDFCEFQKQKSAHHAALALVSEEGWEKLRSEGEGECSYCGCLRVDNQTLAEYEKFYPGNYDLNYQVCCVFPGVFAAPLDCFESWERQYAPCKDDDSLVIVFEGDALSNEGDGYIVRPTRLVLFMTGREYWQGGRDRIASLVQ